jgi:predicted nuclease of restriction endonuclease-like (RecB) superfamily
MRKNQLKAREMLHEIHSKRTVSTTQLKIQIASLTTSRNMISPAAIDHQNQSRIPSLWTTMAAN